jgi:cytochrome P450
VLNDKSVSKPYSMYTTSEILHDSSTNMFGSNGLRWFHARKAMISAFSPKHIRRMRKVTVAELNDFVAKLDADTGEGFDVGKEMINLTLKVMCEAA